MKERVLVTGATGFVGSNLVKALIDRNYEIHILTRHTSNFWRLKDIVNLLNVHEVDLLDKAALASTIEKIHPKKICHLAIYGGYPKQNDNEMVVNTNFIGTLNLLNALKNVDYNCFINTGSSSEYGPKKTKMMEIDYCEPNTMYGVAKAASSMLCQYLANAENKNIGTLRLFSVFGEFEEKGRLIPSLFESIINNKNVKLGNPHSARDFIYIKDVIDVYVMMLEAPDKLKGKIYNVCLGEQKTVLEIAEMVKKILNSSVFFDFNHNFSRKYDSNIWIGDNSLLLQDFNWHPKYTTEAALIHLAKWYMNNVSLYKE